MLAGWRWFTWRWLDLLVARLTRLLAGPNQLLLSVQVWPGSYRVGSGAQQHAGQLARRRVKVGRGELGERASS